MNANPPAAPVVANKAKPVANADTPAPAAKQPAPNNTTAPAKPINPGTTGVINNPATPMTDNAPANVANPAAICPQLRLLIAISCGVNIAIAAETTNNAPAPAILPVIAYIATPSTVNPPANATKPLPISSHPMDDNDLIALPITNKALDVTNKPAPTVVSFAPDMSLVAVPIIVNPPANVINPLAISSHCIPAIERIAELNTCKDAPITAIAAAVTNNLPALPERFENAAISANNTPIPDRPCINLSTFMLPNLDTAS